VELEGDKLKKNGHYQEAKNLALEKKMSGRDLGAEQKQRIGVQGLISNGRKARTKVLGKVITT